MPIAPAAAKGDISKARQSLEVLQAQDVRLQRIGWQLITGNAPYCAETQPSVGLLLQDMAGYSKPDAMRAAVGINGDIAVQAAATGSPAALAGLAPNMEVTSVAQVPVGEFAAPKKGYERLTSLHDTADLALARDGALQLTWIADSTLAEPVSTTLRGVPACTSRFEMLTGGKRASADGQRVLIGTKFAGLAYEDEEFAAAVAHELAHNFLAHKRHLAEVGRSKKNVRVTEREADRLMPWLLANAGYDPAAALRFMERWGPKHSGGFLRKRTHDSWRDRAEVIAAELAIVEELARDHKAADWKTMFRYEITPKPRLPAHTSN